MKCHAISRKTTGGLESADVMPTRHLRGEGCGIAGKQPIAAGWDLADRLAQ
jgi:hypothetical protein